MNGHQGQAAPSGSLAAPGRCYRSPPPIPHMCLLGSEMSQRFTRCCKDREEALQPCPQEAPVKEGGARGYHSLNTGRTVSAEGRGSTEKEMIDA